MASWDLFLITVSALVGILLVLTHISTQVLQEAVGSASQSGTADSQPVSRTADSNYLPAAETQETPVGLDDPVPPEMGDSATEQPSHTQPPTTRPSAGGSTRTDQPELSLTTRSLWANVVFTQGLFGLLLAVIAWQTGVPAAAFGLALEALSATAVASGLAVGVALYGLSELSVRGLGRLGTEPPTALREALAAETPGGWAVLLLVVLPVIAVFEELLFRGAMIGALSVGFDLPVWLLVIVSSVTFGLGHSAQGRTGMVVTGLLGVGLAGVFVWSESLVVVIVAHYVINALEFVVHERG